ncbi:cobalamin B12-binding domain-containing protein [Rosettibacter firmus]|uniref:cobalamin B12-binding domain-containing protein n=1 Tax=Rosettibacter firmus TaxID=3111522 RepID=UPI00336BECB2
MEELINRITLCTERGKVNLSSPYPPDMKGQEGADELTLKALEAGLQPFEILDACNVGMKRIGDKFSRNEVFVPELLMAAKAMQAVMNHLKPYFQKGIVEKKGKFIIGTVAGDLHDIGKNLVSMVVEGNGYDVIDLGVDVKPVKFLDVIKQNPDSVVGLSALLTTTMQNMALTVKEIKQHFPDIKIIVGGAPLTEAAAEKMGADAYGPNPQSAVDFLESLRCN